MSKNPIRETDHTARDLARSMLREMRHATLCVTDPATGFPHVSRIVCQTDPGGQPIALLSGIAAHSRALTHDARAGLMVERQLEKGDPMTWPRLSLQVMAERLPADPDRRDRWLAQHTRSTLFIDLPDFNFWQLTLQSGFLNAGFGAAYRLTPDDLLDEEPITTG
jgi:putative heme iron utilization protein